MDTHLTNLVRDSMVEIERKKEGKKVYSQSLYLPQDVGDRLTAYCKASGAKLSSVVTRALEAYLPRLERALAILEDECDDSHP